VVLTVRGDVPSAVSTPGSGAGEGGRSCGFIYSG